MDSNEHTFHTEANVTGSQKRYTFHFKLAKQFGEKPKIAAMPTAKVASTGENEVVSRSSKWLI